SAGMLYCFDESQTSHRGDWSRGVRRLDGAAAARARSSGHAFGRMGARQLPLLFRRRDASDARYLRSRAALYRNGGPGVAALGEVRAEVESAVFASDRRVVDGGEAR